MALSKTSCMCMEGKVSTAVPVLVSSLTGQWPYSTLNPPCTHEQVAQDLGDVLVHARLHLPLDGTQVHRLLDDVKIALCIEEPCC